MAKSSMGINTFLKIAKELPVHISVLIRGDHGIGKSQLTAQLAEHFGLPIIDKRLSQTESGDIIGLPSLDGGVTRWCPPDWVMKACKDPCVVFFDELNRASNEVLQAVFEIILDRSLAGNKLHPGTRVYSAVNMGAQYTTTDLDPAMLRRFFVCDLEPSVAEWLEYAKSKGIAEEIIDFITTDNTQLDPVKGTDLTDVHQTRASWFRLDETMKFMTGKNEIIDIEDPIFYHLCTGFLGVECAISFRDFVKNRDKQVSGEDVFNNYKNKKIRDKVKRTSQEKLSPILEKLVNIINNEENKITTKNIENVVAFFDDLPAELVVHGWGLLTKNGVQNLERVKTLWKSLTKRLLDVFGVSESNPGATPVIPDFIKKNAN